MTTDNEHDERRRSIQQTRRRFLMVAGVGAGSAALGLLAACSPSPSTSAPAGATTAPAAPTTAAAATTAPAKPATAASPVVAASPVAAPSQVAVSSSPSAAAAASPVPAALVAGGGKATLGFITFNFQAQFFNDLASGVKDAAAKGGADVTVLDPQSKPETQVQMMENLITQKVNAIIIIAADPQGMGPSIQKAADAKIPVIGVDAIIDNPQMTANVGTANRDASKQLGDYAVKWLKDNKGGKANMGIVFATTPIQIERKDGFKEAIAALPDVKILQEVSTQNTLEAATAGVENLIQANPNMDTIFVTSELAVQGSLASFESRGSLGKVPIFGWDVTVPFLDAVQAGNIIGLVQQQPKDEGRIAVESALKVIGGGSVPKSIPVPAVLVTKDNVQDVRKSLGS